MIVLLLSCGLLSIWGQGLALDDCYAKAENNSPLKSQLIAHQGMGELNAENKGAAWKPQVVLNGRMSWQSDVVSLDLDVPIPGFELPEMSKDWYKAYLDITQTIYDGGLIKASKEAELISSLVQQEKVKIDLFEIRTRVNGVFFSNLKLTSQIELAELRLTTLKKQKDKLKSAVENEIQHKSELLHLEAEMIKATQLIAQLKSSKNTSLHLLALLIGEDLGPEIQLEMPRTLVLKNKGFANKRPELDLFSIQKQQLDLQSDMIQKTRRPRVYGFGQAGYGRPGLNMLSDAFDDWYMVGVGLNWKVYDWNETKRKRQLIDMQKDIVSSNEQNFLFQLELAQKSKWDEILTSQHMIESDEKILHLYKEIEQTASSRLANGVITSADYISKLNEMLEAELRLNQRQLEILQLKYEYLTLIGLDYENAK